MQNKSSRNLLPLPRWSGRRSHILWDMFRTSKVQAMKGNLPPVTMGICHLSMGIYHPFPQILTGVFVLRRIPHQSIGKIHLPSIRPIFHHFPWKVNVSLPEGIPSPETQKSSERPWRYGSFINAFKRGRRPRLSRVRPSDVSPWNFAPTFGTFNGWDFCLWRMRNRKKFDRTYFPKLVGGWTNPSEKYESNLIISLGRVENKKNWNHHLGYHRLPWFNGDESHGFNTFNGDESHALMVMNPMVESVKDSSPTINQSF